MDKIRFNVLQSFAVVPRVIFCALLLAPNFSSAQIQNYDFEPIVVSTDVVESVVFSVRTDDSPSSLVLAFSNGTERSLSHQGEGVYTITITHEEALYEYQSDKVNRNFVGFLEVFSGETLLQRGNLFINVEDDSIPEILISAHP